MREIKFRAWDTELNIWLEGVTYTLHTSGRLLTTPPNIILMQFTGLLDKNDEEIYEGDIIEIRGTYYDTKREPVIYESDMHAFMIGASLLTSFGKYFSLEVIGNIYETPELLPKDTP